MESTQIFGISMVVCLVSSIAYLSFFVFRWQQASLAGMGLALVAFLLQTAGIALRWHESYQMGIGHAPLTNMYESLVFFSWSILLVYLFLELKYKMRILGAAAMPMVTLCLAYASFSSRISDQIKPLMPALQSDWLVIHVMTCFIGYAAFIAAAALGVLFLLRHHGEKQRLEKSFLYANLPTTRTLDDLIHKSVVFGFIWLTAGIITGSVWANEAWGSYWSWDPKETWSLITWFFYAFLLHIRFTQDWRGFRIAVMAVSGSFVVIFTYVGVNFYLSGLHSYGAG